MGVHNKTRYLTILLISVCLALFVAGYTPQLARYTRPDAKGTDNLMFAGWFAEDYRVYLSAITLGQNGYLLFRNPFTTEKLAPLPYYTYYIGLGLITGPFHIWPPYVYHIAKLFSCVTFIIASYFISIVVLKSKPRALTATIIGLIATTQPDFFYNQTIAAAFTPWWKDWLEAISRIHQRPHYVLSEALLIFAVAFYLKSRHLESIHTGMISAVIAAIATFMVPHAALPFLIIVAFGSLFMFTKDQHSTFSIRLIHSIAPLFLCLPTIATILFMRTVAIADPVWQTYKDWEVNFWNKDWLFLYHYYSSYWPLILLSLFVIVKVIRKKNHQLLLLGIWIIAPLFISFFADGLGMSKARLLLASIQVPLSILAVSGLIEIRNKLKNTIVPVILIAVFIVYSCVMIGFQMQNMWNRVMKESTYYSLIYVPLNFIEGIHAVTKLVPKDASIASGTIMGNLIPGFAPVITLLGHPTQALHWDEKIAESRQFYGGSMTETDAYQWLKRNNITYVLDDPEMKTFHSAPLSYQWLTPIWQNAVMQLYQVR